MTTLDSMPKTPAWRPTDSLGNRLRLVRAESGRSAEEIATLLKISTATWYAWEHNTARPRELDRIVKALSDLLYVDRDWLMWGGPLVEPSSRCCSANMQVGSVAA